MRSFGTKALLGTAALALVAASCGSSDSSKVAGGSGDGGGDTPFDRNPKVRIMTIAPVNVGTWDPQQHLTYSKVAKAQGWDMEIAEAVPYGEAEQVLKEWAEDDADVVFALDSGFGEAVLKVAPDYPDTVFSVMSALGSNDLPNVTAYAPDYCQMGYMAGAIGALSTESKKVGVVSGLPVPAVEQFFNGAEQGVAATDDGVDINLEYSGDWTDAVKKAETAAGLVSNGADVIFSFDTVPTATDQRVQELGKKVVGIFADESEFAPEAVVTSVIIDWQGYAETVEAVMEDTFEPGIHVRGFQDGMLDVLPSDDKELDGKIEDVKAQLEAGEVEISGDCG
ncbi:MAG: Purine-binding protein precursor [Acidimicrobiales bacterium]|nr:Purine-binding protein precursor [Acidimicrobiales bacterium]